MARSADPVAANTLAEAAIDERNAGGSHSRGGTLLAGGSLAAVVFFFHLGSYGLWEPDEARYAEIAREMLALRDFILPHLNYVAYVEKPPLLYWLTALSFAAGGVSELTARLVPALSAIAGVLATSLFTLRAFDNRRALLASAILATAPVYAVMAQVLTTDMLLTAAMTVSLFAFFACWSEGNRWRWIFYTSMGLGTLAKGPVAIVVPIVVGLAFLFWKRELKSSVARFRPVAGLFLTLAIAAPWFIAVTWREPDFADFYFIGEHVRRFFEPSFSHGAPFYYYLPVVFLGFLPWSLIVPFAIGLGHPYPTGNRAARDFCLVAAATIFGFFSLASGKLIPYILPAFPPLAVAIADLLVSRYEAAPSRRLGVAAAIVTASIGGLILAAALAAPMLSTPYAILTRPALFAAGLIVLAGGAIAGAPALRRFEAAIAIVTLTTAAALMSATYVRLAAEPLRSFADLSRTIAARAPGATLICYHRYVQSLAYYTGQRVILVGPPSELRFGMEHSPDAARYFFATDDDLMKLWRKSAAPVVVIDQPELERLQPRLGRYVLIASEDEKRAILRKDE